MRNTVVKKLRKLAHKEEAEFYRQFWAIVRRSSLRKRLKLAWNILWR